MSEEREGGKQRVVRGRKENKIPPKSPGRDARSTKADAADSSTPRTGSPAPNSPGDGRGRRGRGECPLKAIYAPADASATRVE